MCRKGLWLRIAGILAFLLLCVQNAGGSPASAGSEDGQEDIHLPLVLKHYNYGPGEVSGRVIDAANGRGLEGVSICFDPQDCVLTLQDGTYSATNFSGDWQLTASLTGYYPVIKDVLIVKGEDVELNFAISPYITGGNIELRAVLTWDPRPYWPPDSVENDLDAHLWLDAALPMHVYFDNRGDCTTYPNACLETDFRTGFGPETMAIRQFEPDTIYYFGVLNYNQGANGVPLIRETGAHLEVYHETGLVASYDVSSLQGDGNFWYIFIYSYSPQLGAWVLTPKNCIAYYSSDIQDIISQCP
jgi:hypothetical protein